MVNESSNLNLQVHCGCSSNCLPPPFCPFLFFFSIPKIHPRRWTEFGSKVANDNWKLYFTTLFWNLNFWDNASTLAGEDVRSCTPPVPNHYKQWI